jgi:hypothetical protein
MQEGRAGFEMERRRPRRRAASPHDGARFRGIVCMQEGRVGCEMERRRLARLAGMQRAARRRMLPRKRLRGRGTAKPGALPGSPPHSRRPLRVEGDHAPRICDAPRAGRWRSTHEARLVGRQQGAHFREVAPLLSSRGGGFEMYRRRPRRHAASPRSKGRGVALQAATETTLEGEALRRLRKTTREGAPRHSPQGLRQMRRFRGIVGRGTAKPTPPPGSAATLVVPPSRWRRRSTHLR